MRYTIQRPAVLLDAMLQVPRAWVDVELLQHELTVSNGAYWSAIQAGAPTDAHSPELELWVDKGREIWVPRHYEVPYTRRGAQRFEERQGGVPFRLWTPPESLDVHHNITPRNTNQRRGSRALRHHEYQDKMLAMACGQGKTVVSLHAAAEGLRLPILVVVHTNALMSQWRKAIKLFYGEETRVGHIQGNVYEWEGCPIAVAMLHTLVRREYPPEFYLYWRAVVFDEVHRLGAESFAPAACLFPCERWGLSATMERDDGMDRVFRLHLGMVAYENLEQPLKPSVYFVRTGISVDENKYMFRRGRINLSRLITDLSEDEIRNKLILYWIERAYQKGRTILILGERVAQLNDLCNACGARSKAMHVGSMSSQDREWALEQQVVFATQHLAKEGLDRPAFDTLFILFPFGGGGRLRQSIGRILRMFDKQKPKVFVFEDDIKIMMALCRKMRGHLEGLEFPFKDVRRKG